MAKNKGAAAEAENTENTETETTTTTETPATEPAKTKSIVPAGWKSKNDDLKQFIDKECADDKGAFTFDKFAELAKKNGVDAAKVDHYIGVVASKAHGAEGRAKMTVRNMLATLVRKNSKIVGLDGTETPMTLAKPAVSGAAAAAKEAAASEPAATTEPETPQSEEAATSEY